MARPRFDIHFNDGVNFARGDLAEKAHAIRLSKKDEFIDEAGNQRFLVEGMEVFVFEENYEAGADGEWVRDDIIANGTAHRYYPENPLSEFRWVVRIDSDGIRYESELRPTSK